MSSPAILPLVCPRCGGALQGLEQDAVFGCDDCRRHFEATGSQWVERAVAIAATVDASPWPMLHLPVWEFGVRARATWTDPARQAEASLLPTIERVYVTAFSLHNPAYFGDPGSILTEKRVELRAGAWAPLRGCTRGRESAAQFVEPHILRILDRRVDVTGVALSCIIDEARLWGVPYADCGETLEDRILGLRLPAAALDDLAALRREYRR